MASLNKYQRQNSFISGVNGSLLDGELDRVGLSLGSLVNALLTIRRDDGELKDGIVKAHALHPEAFQKFVDENKAACEPLINQAKAYVDQAANHAERASHYADMVSASVDDARDEADHARQYATDAGKIAKEVECAKDAAHIYEQGTYSWYLKTKFEADAAQRAIKKVKQLAEHVEYETEKAEAAADSAEARAKAACECRRKAEEAATSISQANNKAAEHLQAIARLAVKIAELRTQIDEKAGEIGNNHNQVIVIQNDLSQLQQQLETKVSEALTVLEQATKLVYGAGFSVTPAPNKVPIADSSGKLHLEWLPSVASGLAEINLNLQQIYHELDKQHTVDESLRKLAFELITDTENLGRQIQWLQQLFEGRIENVKDTQELLTLSNWSQFEYVTELNRMTWQSGIVRARKYEYSGAKAYHQPTSVGYSPYNGHSHANIKNLVGTGEFSWMANGIYGRCRHNDDGLYKPCQVGDDFDDRQIIEPPALPADIASLPTPVEQIERAKLYLKVLAGELPQNSVSHFRDAFQWVLTGIEVYPEVYKVNKSLKDPFPGHRHQINVNTLDELFHQEAFYNAGGHKNIRENSVGIAMAVSDVDAEGKPVVVLWRYRFISAPVGSVADYPIDQLLQHHDDVVDRLRWGYTKEQMLESRQARFRVKQQLNQANADGHFNQPTLLDELIGKISGLDGYGNQLTEEYRYYGANDRLKAYGTNAPLKAGYYNRFYTMSGNDASNRRHAMRSFADDKLWVARTTNSRIKSTQFGSDSYAFSYFLPLELHIQSFLNGNFNPYGLTDVSSNYSTTELRDLLEQGIGRKATNPMPGYTDYFFYYKNPSELFSAPLDSDPADTIEPTGLWMKCADGVARKHYVSGYGYFLPTYGVTQKAIRTRYPIYFAHSEGSEAFKYIQAHSEALSIHLLAEATQRVLGELAIFNELDVIASKNERSR